MITDNSPSVASERTSHTPTTAEEYTCPKCGDDVYQIERGGGMRSYICRDCSDVLSLDLGEVVWHWPEDGENV